MSEALRRRIGRRVRPGVTPAHYDLPDYIREMEMEDLMTGPVIYGSVVLSAGPSLHTLTRPTKRPTGRKGGGG